MEHFCILSYCFFAILEKQNTLEDMHHSHFIYLFRLNIYGGSNLYKKLYRLNI